MSLTASFSVAQVAGLAGSMLLTDTSSGSDGSITSRRVYIQTSQGDYLVTDGVTTQYNLWSYAASTIALAVLDKDYAVSIRVDWMAGDSVLYSVTEICVFTQYNKSFFYTLTQNQTASPNIVNDTTYYNNKAILWAEIIGAENAISYASDMYSAQGCLDRATNMRLNESLYF